MNNNTNNVKTKKMTIETVKDAMNGAFASIRTELEKAGEQSQAIHDQHANQGFDEQWVKNEVAKKLTTLTYVVDEVLKNYYENCKNEE